MAVLLSAGLAASVAGAQEASAPKVPSMTVTGRGEVRAVPDTVHFSIGVVNQAPSAAAALTENSKAVSAMIDEAVAAGIARRSIATSGLSVRPVYANAKTSERTAPKIVAYEVSNTLAFEISPVDKAGSVIDALVGRGANRIDDIAFEVSDAEKRLDTARIEAVKAARAKAELFANAAGVRVGRVLEITESTPSTPYPRPMATMRMAADAAPPIEAGEARLSAEVRVTFELIAGSAP